MSYTTAIQSKAREVLASGQAACVIGYEAGTRGRTRPAFVYDPDDVDRLVWNQQCTHNLTTYLSRQLHTKEEDRRVAVVVKPCDSRAVNVLLAENRFDRTQVYVIGVVCEGIREGAGFGRATGDAPLQARCERCGERVPVVYDTLIGEPPAEVEVKSGDPELAALEAMAPAERAAFWLGHFDRCIRCYACRQACPICDCPTCLYERDDSLWVGMAIELDEKRTFHLGRAYHLAGRCIDCNECERVCPVNIPIGLLNRKLIREIEAMFDYRAGVEPIPSPVTTVLSEEERP